MPLKQTNKQTNDDCGSWPLRTSLLRETDATPLRGLFIRITNYLLPPRVRRRLQCTHSLPPFLCTTVTGSAHCLDHTEETELNPFLGVSLLFLYEWEMLRLAVVTKPRHVSRSLPHHHYHHHHFDPPLHSPPLPADSHTLAETRFHIVLPPLDHHC